MNKVPCFLIDVATNAVYNSFDLADVAENLHIDQGTKYVFVFTEGMANVKKIVGYSDSNASSVNLDEIMNT